MLAHEDARARRSAANGLKRLQREDPASVEGAAKVILKAALRERDTLTLCNLTELMGRLAWKTNDRAAAIDMLFGSLGSESALLRTKAMDALVRISAGDEAMRRRAWRVVQAGLKDPSAATRARARLLAKQMQKEARPR